MVETAVKKYRLSKARSILNSALAWYKKSFGHPLSEEKKREFVSDLKALDQALLEKDRNAVNVYANKVDKITSLYSKKGFFTYTWEIIAALLFALVIATIVRQMWFENHEIPTGSMRPTYKEQDKLLVSRTAFGINMPFTTSHLYFDPSLVHRMGVFTFSADNIPMYDADTTYFGIFPYKKRLIKRVMGLPGDTLYFYGGRVYGIDKDGKPLDDLLHAPWMQTLEHIPFLSFRGDSVHSGQHDVIIKQMNIPLAKLKYDYNGTLQGQISVKGQWVKDDVAKAAVPHDKIETYSDFWGFRNFAMVQLLKKEQIAAYGDVDVKELDDAELYLELRHSPSVSYPAPYIVQTPYGNGFVIPGFRSYIPLKSRNLNAIMDTLYTGRFVVEGGQVRRYSAEGHPAALALKMNDVPDGTYEFYFGKAYKITWGGISSELPPEHPLYNRSIDRIQNLFNFGIDFSAFQAPRAKGQSEFPHRYAYFRDGDFYVMGGVVMKKDDSVLEKFIENEKAREKKSTPKAPYVAFIDHGPPDTATIKTFGLTIPEKHYLALGDNHAMSGDSRMWGFVPEDNIQGAPSLIYWPPGSRMGWAKNEPARDWFTYPNVVMWGSMAIILAVLWALHRRKISRSQLPPDLK